MRASIAMTLALALAMAAVPVRAADPPALASRPDWKAHFTAGGATGTIVILDERVPQPTIQAFDPVRARARFTPASTYKIPHTIFALEAGVVRDEFQVFQWDGVQRSFPGHNADQTLRSALRVSALWVYQGFAERIGVEKARDYLQRANYGNADPTAERGDYWVDGNLAISAVEQVAFLKRLYANDLPFARENQRLVKDLMINEAGRDWILRAKTGWSGRLGWWVGWIEWPSGPVFFALNIDTPGRAADLPRREAITRAVLRSIGALPKE